MSSTETVAPWPVVVECSRLKGPQCAQCDGRHEHRWAAWHDAPQVGRGVSVVDRRSGPGLPVRCKGCGARKCDVPECMLRRHHRDVHQLF